MVQSKRLKLELKNVRILQVLRNSLNGELAIVMSISGDLLDLRDKTGAVVRYKFGPHFSVALEDEASDFRQMVAVVRRQQQTGKKKRKPLTAEAFLKRLAKKR